MSIVGKSIEVESKLVLAAQRILGRYGVSFGINEIVLKLIVVMDAQLWEYTYSH